MRLTKTVRIEIMNNALVNAGIIKSEKTNSINIAALADDCYDKISPFSNEEIQDDIDEIDRAIKKLKRHGINHDPIRIVTLSHISVSFSGKQVRLYYHGSFTYSHTGRYTHGGIDKGTRYKFETMSLSLAADDPLCILFEDILRDVTTTAKKRAELIATIEPLLSSVNTVAQLLKKWPDASVLIPVKSDDVSLSQLPALRIEELNKIANIVVGVKKRSSVDVSAG